MGGSRKIWRRRPDLNRGWRFVDFLGLSVLLPGLACWSLVMVGLALALAVPLGVLAAIYVNEYAPASRLAGGVRFVAKLLTGIPSIICGVFAYAVIVLPDGRMVDPAMIGRAREVTTLMREISSRSG